jgi:hypothetical protein
MLSENDYNNSSHNITAKARRIRNVKKDAIIRRALLDLYSYFSQAEEWNNLTDVQKIKLEEYGTSKLLKFLKIYNCASHSIYYRLREKELEEGRY